MQGKRHILITGATGVIGQAIAHALATRETEIILHCNHAHEKAQALKKELRGIGATTHVIAADLTLAGEAERLVAESVGLMDGLSVLVHTAAVFEKTPLGSVTEGQWDQLINLNLRAAFFLAQATAKAMAKNGGKMIFLSDVSASKPYGSYLPYCIAKAGIDTLVKGLARTLAPKITVNAIAPYAVTRPEGISDEGWNDLLNKTPMRRASTPSEVAAIAKMLVESAETITGQVIVVDGGRLLR